MEWLGYWGGSHCPKLACLSEATEALEPWPDSGWATRPQGPSTTPAQITAVEVRSEAGPTGPKAALQARQTMKHISSIASSISYIMKWLILSPNANLTVWKYPRTPSSVVILECESSIPLGDELCPAPQLLFGFRFKLNCINESSQIASEPCTAFPARRQRVRSSSAKSSSYKDSGGRWGSEASLTPSR